MTSLWCHDAGRSLRLSPGYLALATTAAIIAPSCALAQPRVQLAIDESVYLSENPFLLSGGDTGAVAAEIAVRPELDWQVGHTTRLEMSGAARLRHYDRRYGHFVTGRAEATLRHRDSEYLSMRGTLGYVRELPTDALAGGLDAAYDASSARETKSAQLFADWSPDATTMVNAMVGANRTRYPGSALLQTMNAFDYSLGFNKRWSSRTTVGLLGQVAISKSPDAQARTARSLQATIARRLSETWRSDLRAGVEWADAQQPFDGGNGRDRPRFTGSASLCNESVRYLLCLSAALRSEVSAFTGLQRQWRLGSNADIQLGERGRLMLTGDYLKTSGGPVPIDLVRLSAAYDHRIARRFSLKGGVDYLRRSLPQGDRIGAAIVHVTLTFRGFGQ